MALSDRLHTAQTALNARPALADAALAGVADAAFRCGDFIEYADGAVRRVSHVWDDSVQTTRGGSFYLSARGYVEYSGGLDCGTDFDTLTMTDELREGRVWMWDDYGPRAGGGVDCTAKFRVFKSTADSPAY